MSWLDFTGASLSLISTYYFTKSYHRAWVIGILAITLNTILYWQKGIYGHIFLEGVYFFIMIAGLLKWKNDARLVVYQLTVKQFLYCLPVVMVSFGAYAYFLVHYTASTVPMWDAVTTVLSLFAQGLMIYKLLLCWMLWFVVDLMIAILQWQQGMPFHSIVTFLYLGLAVSGYINWKKHLSQTTFEISSLSLFSSKNNSVSAIQSGLANKNP